MSVKFDPASEVFTKPWSEFVGDAMLAEKKFSIDINFNKEMLETIAEAELLEMLGFNLPPVIHSLAIQHERLHSSLDVLTDVVNEYTTLIKRLDTPQVIEI